MAVLLDQAGAGSSIAKGQGFKPSGAIALE